MSINLFKEQMYKELSRVTHAISSPKRMELIDALSQRDYSVEELSKEIGMTIASTSQHLQVLKSAKLVETKRKGNFIIYSISDNSVLQIVSAIREWGFKKLAEIERIVNDFNTDRNILESITIDEFISRSKKEKVLLLDVRPTDEFEAGHIPNAVSIPLDQLKKRIKDLPKGKTIVAYCRGPLCVMAADAVKLLNEKKYNTLHLKEGYIEWKLKYDKLMSYK